MLGDFLRKSLDESKQLGIISIPTFTPFGAVAQTNKTPTQSLSIKLRDVSHTLT